MKVFCLIVFLIPLSFYSQCKIKSVYSLAINNCFEGIISIDKNIKPSRARALAWYVSAGLQKIIDSAYVFTLRLRYGRETQNFKVNGSGLLLPENCYFTNQTLTLLFEPGLILNKRQKFFLVTGIAAFFMSNRGGAGSNSNGYSYIYGLGLDPNGLDYRLGLKWQIKPFSHKKLNFELGAEATFIQHQGLIEVQNSYNSLPSQFFKINYNVVIFYFGIQF